METPVKAAFTLDDAPIQEDWYENGFAKVEGSRKRGVSSMPLPYAQTLLKWAGYVPSTDLAGMLVIDPACGSGNTLLVATQALAARGRLRRWGAERVAQEIEKCIWGLDPDPVACHVTELRLRRQIAHLVPDLPAARRRSLQLHIHQTDSLMMPADGRFKLVITNPPLATARGVVVSYGGFEAKAPPKDVWLKFLEQSMRLVGYGGKLAIALPEAVLTKPAAATLRQELQAEWTLAHLAHVTGVFRSGPGTVMLLLERSVPPTEARVRWERIERLSVTKSQLSSAEKTDQPRTIHSRTARAERRREGDIAQTELATNGRGPWRYALGPRERAFVERMRQPHGAITRAKLGDLVNIGRGAEITKEAPEPTLHAMPGAIPLVRGIDVEPFLAQGGRAYLPASAFKVDPAGWRGPKLVLPRAAGKLAVAMDTTGAAPLSALITITPTASDATPQETLPWLLALLNSPALRAYLTLMHTAYLLARPTIDLDALRELPIALGTQDTRARMVGLALELSRHYATHGTSPDDAMQYPVAQRLEATIAMEVNALYSLAPEDLAVVENWRG